MVATVGACGVVGAELRNTGSTCVSHVPHLARAAVTRVLRSAVAHRCYAPLATIARFSGPGRVAPLRAATTEELATVSANLHPDIERLLFTEEEIHNSIQELGKVLAEEYKDKQPLLLTTLAGAFMFTADLCRAINPVPDGLQLDFPRASSYGQNAVSSGNVELQFNLTIPIEGRHVLLVEDLIDTGRTLKALLEKLEQAKPASIKVVTLLRKAIPREIAVEPDYFCLEWEKGFIVGYGLDFDECYRSLPYIGILKKEVYAHTLK